PKGSFLPLFRSRRVTRIGAALVGGALGALVAGPPGAALGLVAGITIPLWIRRRNAAKGAAALEEQLPDAVSAMSAGMRSGMSLSQSIRFAAGEVAPPLSRTLGELVEREQLGVPLAASLEDWTKPDLSHDLRLVGGILQLHRRTGGDLPAVLDQLAETLRNRADATRELRGYTAQARLSGAILGGLPIGFFLFLSLTSRNDIAAAYRTPIGGGAILVGLILEALAFVWIRHLLRVAT
ncbi:MAG: type II secretion system F family protein, partial [Actinomycetota bacterium]|nr:type II secretion system F family protein [Actinomycetota bacterium]